MLFPNRFPYLIDRCKSYQPDQLQKVHSWPFVFSHFAIFVWPLHYSRQVCTHPTSSIYFYYFSFLYTPDCFHGNAYLKQLFIFLSIMYLYRPLVDDLSTGNYFPPCFEIMRRGFTISSTLQCCFFWILAFYHIPIPKLSTIWSTLQS